MDFRQKIMMSPLYDWLGKRSYAQCGEDLIADAEMGKKKKGFYVDIGSYHPKVFSNTYLFYKRGWEGICVDPNPELEELFAKARPRDNFLNMGVGDCGTGDGVRLPRRSAPRNDGGCVKEYFMFEDGAANTFSKLQAELYEKSAGRKLIQTRMVAVLPLKTIFEKFLPNTDTKIDLLSVDVEGLDEEVLKSNDWKKYRPEMIICEDLDFDLDNPKKSGVYKFLVGNRYRLVAKTPYSLIFRGEK